MYIYMKGCERMEDYMPSDKQYNGQLIEEYQRLLRILKVAEKGDSFKTIDAVKEELHYIKLKLHPTELPDFSLDPAIAH